MKNIRSINQNDLHDLIEVQKKTFTSDLCESMDVFQNRFDRFGQFFKVAVSNNQIVGYIICFPYKLGEFQKTTHLSSKNFLHLTAFTSMMLLLFMRHEAKDLLNFS